jgi:predicted membrane protein
MRPGTEKLYSGPIDCVKKVFQREGVKGFFAGLAPTIGTRLIGSPVYFGTYEAAKRFLGRGEETVRVLSTAQTTLLAATHTTWCG